MTDLSGYDMRRPLTTHTIHTWEMPCNCHCPPVAAASCHERKQLLSQMHEMVRQVVREEIARAFPPPMLGAASPFPCDGTIMPAGSTASPADIRRGHRIVPEDDGA